MRAGSAHANLADVYEYDSTYRLIRAAYRAPAADVAQIQSNATTNADAYAIQGEKSDSYLLDGVGNWRNLQTDTQLQSTATGTSVNEMNEYETFGTANITHDDNGNQTANGKHRYYNDALNRLTRVEDLAGLAIAHYKYDALGRRIRKSTSDGATAFFYSGKHVVEERSGSGSILRQFVYGNRIDEVLQMRSASGDYYYHDNSLGSVVALTDARGVVVERYRYSAYGETTTVDADGIAILVASAVGNPYGFTGRRLDRETGIYYYRARYYDPRMGRFLQHDPRGYVDGMGLYVYVALNPINLLDPDGENVRRVVEGFMQAAAVAWTLAGGAPTMNSTDDQNTKTEVWRTAEEENKQRRDTKKPTQKETGNQEPPKQQTKQPDPESSKKGGKWGKWTGTAVWTLFWMIEPRELACGELDCDGAVDNDTDGDGRPDYEDVDTGKSPKDCN